MLTVRREGQMMHPDLRGRRHTPLRAALVLATTVTTTALAVPPAQADPRCDGLNPAEKLGCFNSRPGGTSGGRGGSGGVGGGTTIPDPEDANLDENVQDLGPAAAPTTVLADSVEDTAPYPAIRVHTAPAARTYVRVRTGLWVEGFETVQTEPITLDGQTIQATATPTSVTWNLGETTITCNGPGRPNDTSCSHTYKRSSTRQPGGAYRISAAITWTVTWTCTGAPCDAPSGTLDPTTLPSEPVSLVVDEIQTNTRS